MLYAPFIDGSGHGTPTSASQNYQLDRLQNMYVENRTMAAAKTDKVLVGAPGSKVFYDLGDGPVRGQISGEGFDFIVSGGNVWRKDPNDNFLLIGTCTNDGMPVGMCWNNQWVFFCSAGVGYTIAGITVSLVPSPPWSSLIDVSFMDGYFIGLDDTGQSTGGQFFLSSLNDPTTWDPLDFATVPSSADKLRALAVSHKMLYVIGSVITQPFYDSGNADFPFVPNQSGAMEVGTMAKNSVCTVGIGGGVAGGVVGASDDNIIYMLSQTPNGRCQLVKIVGFNSTVVSTAPISSIWQEGSEADAAAVVVWSYQEKGHFFVQVCWPQNSQFPVGSQRYDATTDRWADVTWTNPATGQQEAHRGINHSYNQVHHLIGDREEGILWKFDSHDYFDGDPDNPAAKVPQVCLRECLLPSDGTKTMFLSRVELLCETGIGDGSGNPPGDDPQVLLELSGNAGHSYDPNPEQISMGKQGQWDTRVVWTGCGSGRQLAVRISSDAPVKKWWYGLDIQMTEGVA